MLGGTIALSFAGHLDDATNLVVVGITGSVMGITTMSVSVGINSAQETLTTQAFGAGQHKLCGIYLNRGQIILTFFFVLFASIPMCFGEKIFLFISKDDDISVRAAYMLRMSMPALFINMQYDLW